MTHMEIATHLGLLAIALNEEDEFKKDKTMQKCLEALRESQIVMYEFARQELIGMILEDGGVE